MVAVAHFETKKTHFCRACTSGHSDFHPTRDNCTVARLFHQVVGNIDTKIFEAFSHDLLDFFQSLVASQLSGACHHLFALRIDDTEVPPSGIRQSGTPQFHWLTIAR